MEKVGHSRKVAVAGIEPAVGFKPFYIPVIPLWTKARTNIIKNEMEVTTVHLFPARLATPIIPPVAPKNSIT